MITEQDITDTLNSYTADEILSYDALLSQMREVQSHIETAREYLRSAKIELPVGPLTASVFDLIRRADDHLAFALTAWEPD